MAETTLYKLPYPVVGDSPAGPAQIKALAEKVEGTKFLSQNLKPTSGVKQASANLGPLSGSYQDVPGTTLEITPVVASVIRIWATFGMQGQQIEGIENNEVFGIVNLDGVDQTTQYAWSNIIQQGTVIGSRSLATQLALAGGEKHTIKLRAKKTGSLATWFVIGAATHYLYDLFAS